jgi:hypothetical protein
MEARFGLLPRTFGGVFLRHGVVYKKE